MRTCRGLMKLLGFLDLAGGRGWGEEWFLKS